MIIDSYVKHGFMTHIRNITEKTLQFNNYNEHGMHAWTMLALMSHLIHELNNQI